MNNYSLENITWVGIETTNVCNMTCDYCPKSLDELNHRVIGANVLNKEVFIKIIDYFSNLPNLEYVALTAFNEFFLTSHLTSFYLPELKKRGLQYVITTNGSIQPKNIEYYIDHQPKYLILGLQTITEEQFYNNNRLENTSWDEYLEKVVELIKFFYSNCPDTLISVEIATNEKKSFFNKIIGIETNKNIPPPETQLLHSTEFIKKISDLTGIEFDFNTESNTKIRYAGQKIAAKSPNGQLNFALKEFMDNKDFYNNIPTSVDPICHAETLTFNVRGHATMCCIDFRGSTKFGDVVKEDMADIFSKYLKLVDTMRTKGSPFKDCRKCMGYKNKTEKNFNVKKRLYTRAKKIPLLVDIRNKIRS